MPALASVVTDFLDALTGALKQGSDLGSNVRGAAQNYLRAQDMATVIELLQDALDTGTLTATANGSTTTVVDGAGTFTADEMVGNTVVFDGNITAAIAGEERVIIANTETTLTFSPALSAATQTGDTYSVRWTVADKVVDDLREGRGRADSPRGSVYGEHRMSMEGLVRLLTQLGASVPERNIGWTSLETGSGSTTTSVVVDQTMAIDQMKGAKMTVSGQSRIVSHNTEDTLYFAPALSSAPAAATAVALTVPQSPPFGVDYAGPRVHPGSQPGENANLAYMIETLQATVAAYTLPT